MELEGPRQARSHSVSEQRRPWRCAQIVSASFRDVTCLIVPSSFTTSRLSIRNGPKRSLVELGSVSGWRPGSPGSLPITNSPIGMCSICESRSAGESVSSGARCAFCVGSCFDGLRPQPPDTETASVKAMSRAQIKENFRLFGQSLGLKCLVEMATSVKLRCL